MKLRIASVAACALLAAPVLAQAEDEDVQVDLEAIDALFADEDVTEPEDGGEVADEEGEVAEDDGDTAVEGEGDDNDAADAADAEGEDEPEISDLTRAFNGYSLCASEAGVELEEQGFAIDQIGSESLLRCGGQRAAYVNAFYFSLLPRYSESSEQQVREAAERLVTQSDAALMNLVTSEVRELRNARPEQEAASDEAEADAETEENAGAPPLNLQWFDDEDEAANIMEAHLRCLTNGASARSGDERPVEAISEEIVAQCADEAAALTSALTDIFERKPEYLPEGADPEWAAQTAVAAASRSVERLVAAERNQD